MSGEVRVRPEARTNDRPLDVVAPPFALTSAHLTGGIGSMDLRSRELNGRSASAGRRTGYSDDDYDNRV